MEAIEKVWGTEEIIINDQVNNICVKRMTIKPKHFSSWHLHPKKSEYFHVISGSLCVETINFGPGITSDNRYPEFTYENCWVGDVDEGTMLFIRNGCTHIFCNNSDQDVIFMEYSNYHSDDDVVRFSESGKYE